MRVESAAQFLNLLKFSGNAVQYVRALFDEFMIETQSPSERELLQAVKKWMVKQSVEIDDYYVEEGTSLLLKEFHRLKDEVW